MRWSIATTDEVVGVWVPGDLFAGFVTWPSLVSRQSSIDG